MCVFVQTFICPMRVGIANRETIFCALTSVCRTFIRRPAAGSLETRATWNSGAGRERPGSNCARRQRRRKPSKQAICIQAFGKLLGSIEHHLDNTVDIAISGQYPANIPAKAPGDSRTVPCARGPDYEGGRGEPRGEAKSNNIVAILMILAYKCSDGIIFDANQCPRGARP